MTIANLDPAMMAAYIVHPGQTLVRALDLKGWTQTELARRTGYTVKAINQVCRGQSPLRPEMALAFERELGIPAALFVCMQASWDLEQVRLKLSEVAAGVFAQGAAVEGDEHPGDELE